MINQKLLLIMLGLFMIPVVSANIGIVVDYNTSVQTECIVTDDSMLASSLLDRSQFQVTYSPTGAFGRLVCKINGIGTEVEGQYCAFTGDYWGLYLNNPWTFASSGVDSQTIVNGDRVGFQFGDGSVFPADLDACDIEIDFATAYYEGVKDNIQYGEDIEMEQGILKVKVGVVNNFNVESEFDIEVDAKGLPGQSEDIDIDDGDSDDVSFTFNLTDVEPDDYDFEIIVRTEVNNVDYLIWMPFEVELDERIIINQTIPVNITIPNVTIQEPIEKPNITINVPIETQENFLDKVNPLYVAFGFSIISILGIIYLFFKAL